MIYYKKKIFFILIYGLSVLALFSYLYGFFPIERKRFKRDENGKAFQSSRHIDKLAIIVIDALRYDFIMSNLKEPLMPFTMTSILKNNSCIITTKAHSPTVTMPRIKAITSGTVSTYIDVVMNFMSYKFDEDNFIRQAANNGFKTVFYGDNTWLNLFPNEFFRSEGVNSFFANDYTEVDNNVTRHLHSEFKKNDWDIMILHFLGVDHIGHTKGPQSSVIKPKLLEMDEVIRSVSRHFKNLENRGQKTMLIVTGDHGMKDSGGHGGISYSEVHVPLVSVGSPCNMLSGWPENSIALQIDIAPTISTLLGLPIPENCVGKIIPSLLKDMKTDLVLKYLEKNRLHLSKFLDLSDSDIHIGQDFKLNISYENGESIVAKYYEFLSKYSEEIVNRNSDLKFFYIIFGLIFLWFFLLCLLKSGAYSFETSYTSVQIFFVFGTVLHGISFSSTSFIEEEHQTWYFLWATFCFLTITEFLRSKKLTKFQKITSILPWVLIICLHRILRKLNQTGDKWASIPDLKFYLNLKEGQPWLSFLFLIGAGMLVWCALSEKCSSYQLASFISCIIIVLCFHCTRNVHLKYLIFSYSPGETTLVSCTWLLLIVFLIQSIRRRTPAYLVWLLFASLLLRPHNLILPGLEVFISKQINNLFTKPQDLVWNNVAHFWLANTFYFYQGQGNSLANIDVSSGFIGVNSYIPSYAFFMIAAHTFNSFILSFMLSPKSSLVLGLSRMIPLTFYCTFLLFQLHHLFIWSVLSPKLLYEASITILFFGLILSHCLLV